MRESRESPPSGSLCAKGRCAAKARYESFPSAYASGHGAQVCSGRVRAPDGSRVEKKASRSKKKTTTSLGRWYKEKWVNACDPRHPPCGRQRGSNPRSGADAAFPYCRPTVRVSSKTPRLLSTLSKAQIKRRCEKKRASPSTRVRDVSPSYRGGDDEPRWMSYRAAHAHEAEARDRKVSKVARSSRGFMRAYEKHKTAERTRRAVANERTGRTWGETRRNFVRRHMAQYVTHPTRRRWLALVMWAYRPPGPAPPARSSPR